MMKNRLKDSGTFILFACLALMVLTACSEQEKLKELVKAANVSCPMKVDEVTTLDSLTIESDKVVYHYTIDESGINMDALENNAAEMKQNIKASLDVAEPALKLFLEACVKNRKGLGYQYAGNASGKTFEHTFSVSEIKTLL